MNDLVMCEQFALRLFEGVSDLSKKDRDKVCKIIETELQHIVFRAWHEDRIIIEVKTDL